MQGYYRHKHVCLYKNLLALGNPEVLTVTTEKKTANPEVLTTTTEKKQPILRCCYPEPETQQPTHHNIEHIGC